MDIVQFAERVRAACLKAASDAYEDAGVQGLCAEGRWEAALGAAEALDLHALVQELTVSPAPPGAFPP
jgi:hypothetical protein